MLFDSSTRRALRSLHDTVAHSRGGIRQRVEEHRALIEIFECRAPDVMALLPWIARALESQDFFFVQLLEAVEERRTIVSTISDFWSTKELELFRKKVAATCGGITKRVDENRELLETLHGHAPDLLQYFPAIEEIIRSHDIYLTRLLEAVVEDNPVRRSTYSPRAMPAPSLHPLEQDTHVPLASNF